MLLGFFANFAQNDYGALIIGLSLLAISTLLFAKTFLVINHQRVWRWGITITYLAYFFAFAFSVEEELRIPLIILGTLIPFVLIPIIIYVQEKKQTIKTNFFEYFFTLCFALFSLGLYLKIFHVGGGSVIRVWSLFVVFPIITRVFVLARQSIKQKTTSYFLRLLFVLFLGTWMIGFSFKLQHWPWANNILLASYVLLFLLFVSILFVAKKGEKFVWFSSSTWTARVTFVCFVVITIYYNLSKNNLAPQLYSNEFPPAMEELLSKDNNLFTPEGKENQRKADVYREYYYTFLDNLEKEKK
jgi:hypothetical protein